MATKETIGRPMEILLVEDNLQDAGTTIQALKQGAVQCRVSLVTDAEDALRFLRRESMYAKAPRPDLILLDLKLPGMDGRQFLVEIRADRNLKSLPVVVMTTSPVHEEILKDQKLDVDSYMIKPVDQGQFVGTVKKLRRFWLEEIVLPSLD